MSRRTVLAAVGALVVLGALAGILYLRPATGTSPSGAAATAPPDTSSSSAASAPRSEQAAGEAAPLRDVLCIPSTDLAGPIVLRAEPSNTSGVLSTVGSGSARLVWLDTRTIKGGGDWIRVAVEGTTGWIDGQTVACRHPPELAQEIIAAEAERVLGALQARDVDALASRVHPIKGLRFSPYVDIDPRTSVVLTAAEIQTAFDERTPRRWGSEDGSGEPILRTFAEYYGRFVYDRAFARAPQKRFNEFGGRSTTRPNILEVYPHAIVVEAHVPGTNPESEGMDWASLLLVFEQHDSRWYLSALVHDQWTI